MLTFAKLLSWWWEGYLSLLAHIIMSSVLDERKLTKRKPFSFLSVAIIDGLGRSDSAQPNVLSTGKSHMIVIDLS